VKSGRKVRRKKRRTPGRPIAYSHGHWRACKGRGDEGENVVFSLFARRGYPFQRFVVPDALSVLPLSEQHRETFASEFKKEFFFDGLARIDGTPYAIEVKWKSYVNFVVDIDCYDKLFKLSKVIPVLVVFYIKGNGSIHFHDVRDPKREPAFETDMQQDSRIYRIPANEIRLVSSGGAVI
jgi:hypothetical protein